MEQKPRLKLLDAQFDVHKLSSVMQLEDLQGNWFLSSTDEELSLVCEGLNRELIKDSVQKSELNWRSIKVEGPLDFSMTGVIAGLSNELAKAEIPIFVVSTFETDYLLVKERNLAETLVVLKKSGYVFV
ncbi:ACT domain-containing protein [Kangiella aquimarina]|uniref:ACT domain-containing protein n=1 Tax=Kangiella aquimarina TaxID=261965 RepID=A0ABZ0X5A2_9GAMM|nr:ACT domain-containing protein [Kangiella aquimarina]WQG85563.1 ACT domain-containing protein [Kangiella aquimarina]